MDLNKYIKDLTEQVQDVQKVTAFEIYKSVVEKTPVDTGRARANWQISTGKPSDEITEDISHRVKSADEIETPKNEESIYISNNLPYIKKLEYGGYTNKMETEKTINGFSKQAPAGMVDLTLANKEKIIKKAVEIVKKRSKK